MFYKLRIIIYSLSHLALSYCFEMILIVSPTRRFIKRFTLLSLLLIIGKIFNMLKISQPQLLQKLLRHEQGQLKLYKQLMFNSKNV